MLLAIPQSRPSSAQMYWQRAFPGRPDQARQARSFLRALLPAHPSLDDMLLVVDELAANAVQHTRSGEDGGVFEVGVLVEAERVVVSVTDQGGPKVPADGASDELAESGRGLILVAALADRCRWSGTDRSRTVTAAFPAS
ncbi:ATP-binding protein [Actinomadura rupiterrae]|uniref:ATP-binding protein n=1 Tax=Actinomadura rupiterrae TaxID=559627 RepID=UPI0020A4DAA0|nr:ATP-binding protein [Actinomadura rupiterrae]MCP2336560.1 anti-sigma regulatory factor (Ser/Thr protein kinase) [Actinomadura rupiterrae]